MVCPRDRANLVQLLDSTYEDPDMLMFLHENRTEGCSGTLIRNIVLTNQLPTLWYVHEHNVSKIPVSALLLAAQHGCHNTLAYLVEHCFSDVIAQNSPLVLDAIEEAATCGHIRVLEYFDAKKTASTQKYTTKTMDKAAALGIIDTLKYLHFHDHTGCTTDAMEKAAANGHLMVVRFLHEYRSEGCTTNVIDQAAANGHARIVKFLLEHRSEGYTYKAVDTAKKNKHTKIVALLPDYRVPWKY